MLKGIDISNWQNGLKIKSLDPLPDFVIAKATEGIHFVDSCCDSFIQDCIKLDIPFGFYHFASSYDAKDEAKFFYDNTLGYINKGIPILDFEVPNSNDWLETFCKEFYSLSGIFPIVYMNSNYVNNLGYGTEWLKNNCGLWLAGYPDNYTNYPNVDMPYPTNGWTLALWQFTSSLNNNGFTLDGDFFYGDKENWLAYATAKNTANLVTNNEYSILELAFKTIKGEYGNGKDRINTLGDKYEDVQIKINNLYVEANNVIKGKYGNGDERKRNLGDEYDVVQYIVNNILK